jgi:hypothetical protein
VQCLQVGPGARYEHDQARGHAVTITSGVRPGPDRAGQAARPESRQQADGTDRAEGTAEGDGIAIARQPITASRKELALPADKSPPRPPLSFPEQSAGQGPPPAPGGAPGNEPQHGTAPPDRAAPKRPGGTPPNGQRQPGRPATPALQQRAIVGLVLGLLSMFGLLGVSDLIGVGNVQRYVYLVAFSLCVGAIALWLGISAVAASRRTGTGRPRGAVSAIILGGIGVLFSILLLVTFTVLWKQLSTYSRCMAGANTPTAQQACRDQLTRSLNAETSRLRSSR